MNIITPAPKTPIITVFRKITQAGNRYWFYANSCPVEMAEQIAIKEANRGNIILKTVGDA